MKQRPLNHPLIVHVAEDWDLRLISEEIHPYAQKLIDTFWPGPLTLVVRCRKDRINPLITAGQDTVAIRCPAHPITQQLLKKIKTPLVAPSANPFGKISPTTAQHVQESFPEQQLLILDGGRCTVGIESTIVDVTHAQHHQILRHGMLDEQAIRQVTQTQPLKRHSTVRVPGALENHYQPHKTLYYFTDNTLLEQFCRQQNNQVFVIAHTKPNAISQDYFCPLATQAEQAAYDLYYQLRTADASSATYIAIQLPAEEHAWLGVRERILKAGTLYP